MFYTCAAHCSDPTHRHRALAATAAGKASASARIVRSRSGKHKVVDLHCHYLNPEVSAKTAHLNAAQYDPTVIFANDLTRQTNVKQMARTPNWRFASSTMQ